MLIKTRMSLQIQSFFNLFVENGDEIKEDSETDEEFKNIEKNASGGKKNEICNEKSSFHEHF